jgi:putative ABC transport system permease protein
MPAGLGDARELAAVSAEALRRYPLRTALSVLGVVIGVACVIAMLSVAEGAARGALAEVEALGLDNLVARSLTGGLPREGTHGLTAGDARLVRTLVPMTSAASPLIRRMLNVSHGAGAADAAVLGVGSAYRDILRLTVDRGRFLTPTDQTTSTRVCVLGAQLSRRLFRFRNPVGEPVRLGQDDYVVVGVLSAAGTTATPGAMAWHDVDASVFVPFETLSGRSIGVGPDQPVDEIWLRVTDGSRAIELGRAFERVLGRTRPDDSFTVVVPREILAQRYRTQRTFGLVVGSVALLSLLVGGVGIMNNMLASVIDRTREIGVRRVAGATRRDVLRQFLVEAVMMTLGGGVLGVLIGALVSAGISDFAGWATHVSTTAVILALVMAVLVGLVFGLYPALRAARLEPVDALRYE